MLFNSYTFIFCFLPITLAVYYVLGRVAARPVALGWLVICSLVHYAWWQPSNLFLLGFSLSLNYSAGVYLGRTAGGRRGKLVLILGIAVNLALLGYFKYFNFFLNIANDLAGTQWHLAGVVLPLGISFYTFQQIAYLVDAYDGLAREYNFVDYCLFVTFFPQLIAGPIVHHGEMLPQFTRQKSYRVNASDLGVGISIFLIGLFKKVVIADNVALFASPIFNAARYGKDPTFAEGWGAALAYTFQLYYDFSGYSDMALGLGRLFGIKLPLNFNSPYKAVNIADFWRRWHMTLSRFLRDYLYFPLGGNRHGKRQRYMNLMTTMLLGGMWHGAGWTFIFWGGLHGLYLVIYSGWSEFRRRIGFQRERTSRWGPLLSRALTFLCVVIGWVYFRAANFRTANRMLSSMAGLHGFDLHASFDRVTVLLVVVGLLTVVWTMPNTQEVFAAHDPYFQFEGPSSHAQPVHAQKDAPVAWIRWVPNTLWAITLVVMAIGTLLLMSKLSEFIYWQF